MSGVVGSWVSVGETLCMFSLFFVRWSTKIDPTVLLYTAESFLDHFILVCDALVDGIAVVSIGGWCWPPASLADDLQYTNAIYSRPRCNVNPSDSIMSASRLDSRIYKSRLQSSESLTTSAVVQGLPRNLAEPKVQVDDFPAPSKFPSERNSEYKIKQKWEYQSIVGYRSPT